MLYVQVNVMLSKEDMTLTFRGCVLLRSTGAADEPALHMTITSHPVKMKVI